MFFEWLQMYDVQGKMIDERNDCGLVVAFPPSPGWVVIASGIISVVKTSKLPYVQQ